MAPALQRAVLLALRVAVGTGLFAIVLIAVQSSDARIAGMMIAFPALNGISLLMAPLTDKPAMARAMLPVIALNGWLAMGFIVALGMLVDGAGLAAAHWIWPLAAAAFVIWLVVITALASVTPRAGTLLLGAFLIAAPLLVALWWRCLRPDSADPGVMAVIADGRSWRIGLFAATLLLLLLIADLLGEAHAVLGRLGAFPLLPLFSLATIAHSGSTPVAGLDKLVAARPAIVVGILLAMAFAVLYARWLKTLQRRPPTDWRWWLTATAGLLTGWLLTAPVIFALASAMRLAESRIALLGCH